MKDLRRVPLLALLIAGSSYAQAGPPADAGLHTQGGQAQVFAAADPSGGSRELPAKGEGIAPLPDAPGAQLAQAQQTDQPKPPPCLVSVQAASAPEAASAAESQRPCRPNPDTNPYKRFLDNGKPIPLSPKQKGYLAVHDVIDPFNLLTIVANSAFTIGIDAHTAYGPGMPGFGRSVGYSFLQDATGEFIGTFAVCSALHEDPHYHRLPQGTPFQRIVHAISRTVIAQHDNGKAMPNYENFITYPASAEISNLYVPGVHVDAPSTVARIFIGLATDPVNNLITEFLPDFAKRVHVRVVFVQQIINQVARGESL